MSYSAMSMKHLIAAAQARKRQAHLQNSCGNHFPFPVPDFDMPARRLSPIPATLAFESSKMFQQDVQVSLPDSPCSNTHQLPSINQHENEDLEETRVCSGHHSSGSSLSGDTEAAVARDGFEGMIETLSMNKESIARATRLAIDCAKYGLTTEQEDQVGWALDHRKEIYQFSDYLYWLRHLPKQDDQIELLQIGIAGASYVSTVQAALSRLIGAAGSGAKENRRQCHKVLRLWLERKILPESVIHRYMDDILVDSNASIGISSRHPSQIERSFDDPIREMEGMVVDEYGSNATLQLPGLLAENVFEEVEEYEDNLPTNLSKEADDTSPSELTPTIGRDSENQSVTPCDRRHCILEIQRTSLLLHVTESASNVSAEWLPSPEGSPPLPSGSPPATPPLPTSPPPPPPPMAHQNQFPQLFVGPPQPPIGPPPRPIGPPLPDARLPPPSDPLPPVGVHSQAVGPPQPVGLPPPLGPPPLPSQQLFPPQPPFISLHMADFQGNESNLMVPNTHGSRADASQALNFPLSGVRNAQELVGYNPSRQVEYGQGDAYVNQQATQHWQQFLPGHAPFAQRSVHPELLPQRLPCHFPYPHSLQQHEYPPYPLPNFSDGQRRYATDEQWRIQGNEFNGGWTAGGRSCSGPPYPHEGYFGRPLERPPANNVNFQPSAPNTQPSTSQIPVHGVPMMLCRPDMSAVNWRPQ